MRILFINPNLRPGNPTQYLPVGMGYVMTVVKQAGYDIELLDIALHDHRDPYVEQFLAENRYDVILTGAIVTHYKWMKWVTRAIKKHQPECKIIVGNSVGGSIPDLFLTHSAADVVVVGEGEWAALETLDALRTGGDLGKVAGIVWRRPDGSIQHNEKRHACDIAQVPLIDWDLFDVQRYFTHTDMAAGALGVETSDPTFKWRVMPVSTARGCVFKCTFCHIVFKHDPYRHRSAEHIMAEVERNIYKYGAHYINFWDDLSFYKLSQAEKLVDAILASGLKFYWNAAVRSDLFGRDDIPYDRRLAVAEKFAEAGCVRLGFSLESGNPEILEMMEKRVKVEYFAEQVSILRKVGIHSDTSIVIGYPIETRDTIRQTFKQCEDIGIYPSIGFLLPLPDTGMYEHARKHGFITDEDAFLDSITERQDICLNMTTMSSDEIMDEIKRGASRLNDMLELGLSENRYIRTGGYRKHSRLKKVELPINPEHLRRNTNDVSFNYTNSLFNERVNDRAVATRARRPLPQAEA